MTQINTAQSGWVLNTSMLNQTHYSNVSPEAEKSASLFSSPNVLVLAVGNLLMTDEGAGIHTLNYLIEHNADDDLLSGESIEYIDAGTLSFTIAAHIENADQLIIIDAAELHAPPGTVKVFTGDDMIKQLGQCKLSVHEVGLIDLMDMVTLNDRMPEKYALVGIQPLTIADWSDEPSPEVKAAIPRAAEEVNRLIREWQHVD